MNQAARALIRQHTRAAAAIMTLMAVAACHGPGNETSRYHTLPRQGWRYSDTLALSLEHPDSVVAGRLAVGVTHAATYPYADLWLEISCPAADPARRDTVVLRLADRYGRWTGHGIGSSFQVADTISRPLLHASGTPVTVRHIMRADTLPGIERVGVFLLPADE